MLVRPHHVSLRETMLWLEPRIAKANARILEIGCGQGHLSAVLAGAGHHVIAIDHDPTAITAARYKGVDARLGRFPAFDQLQLFDEQPFDVVLFHHSLHLAQPLEAACEAAFGLLAPDGTLLVEDWSWDCLDARTAAWAYGLMGFACAAGLAPDGEWLRDDDPLASWLLQHTETCHATAAMRAALNRHQKHPSNAGTITVTEEPAPYFYRYFCDYLAEHEHGAAIVESALAAEQEMLAACAMAPLGWRVTATRSDS